MYPCDPQEEASLHDLKSAFDPLPPYIDLESRAKEQDTLVSIDLPSFPDGQIAFLENTNEKCTSPQTKHKNAHSAKHWVQRVDTPDRMFERLTDGYCVSLMFGERCHQYIRNANNWRGASGILLDIDVFRDEKHPDAPEPVYSMQELFERYPLIKQICSYLIPSASSLYEDRPFKARGIILFPTPVTDIEVFKQFGNILCEQLDCLPVGVTKNPVAIGYGNTHNAEDAVYNAVDTQCILNAFQTAVERSESIIKTDKEQQQQDAERREKQKQDAEHNKKLNENLKSKGYDLDLDSQKEPISEFIKIPAADLFTKHGLATHLRNNEWHWHNSSVEKSFELVDGTLKVYSASMQSEFPSSATEEKPINAHRFLAYHLYGRPKTKT